MPLNLPNILTLSRIATVPVLVILFYLPYWWAPYLVGAIFLAAAFTDWLDGYLARVWKQTTKFGTFLDPVADKLVVVTLLVLLIPRYHMVALPAVVIIGREIAVSALREWMAEMGKRASIAVSMVGKIKTVLQMIAILIIVIFGTYQHKELLNAGIILLYVAALLTLWSMLMYLKVAWPNLMDKS